MMGCIFKYRLYTLNRNIFIDCFNKKEFLIVETRICKSSYSLKALLVSDLPFDIH